MTAPLRTPKSIGPGQRRLVTYGKPSRKRTAEFPIAEDVASRRDAATEPRASTSAPSPHPAQADAIDNTIPKPLKRTERSQDEATDSAQRKRKRPLPSENDALHGTTQKGSTGGMSKMVEAKAPGRQRPELNESNHKHELKPPKSATETGRAPAASTQNPTTSLKRYDIALCRDPSIKDGSHRTPQNKPRKARLIDTLTAQRAKTPESEDDMWPITPYKKTEESTPLSQRSTVDRDVRPQTTHRPRDTIKRGKIKFTYSQSRSINTEGPKLVGDGVSDSTMQGNPLLPASLMPDSPDYDKGDPFDFDDGLEEDTGAKNVIKSVHELRRAGAHNRFADEMEDLLSRISTPGSESLVMRRNALLELAHKLQTGSFASQFRDHAARDNIAKRIGEETDVICGFALAAVLVIFLTLGPAPHLLRQLGDDGLGRMLSRLLCLEDDIEVIASQRDTNMSMISRRSLGGVKAILKKMGIWHGHQLSKLSPRILALRLLDVFLRYSDPIYLQEITRDVQDDITDLGKRYTQEVSEDDVEYALVLSVLEAQSNAMAGVPDGAVDSLATPLLVSKLLQIAIDDWNAAEGQLEATALKLAINTTNTERGAAALHSRDLLAKLEGCINRGFQTMLRPSEGRRSEDVAYENLLLLLGIMINVVEHYPPARTSLEEDRILDLVTLYTDHKKLVSEATTEEKSELGVAFGYLAVLLGYLSLAERKGKAISGITRDGASLSLIKTIQDFIDVYRNVDGRVHEMEGLVRDLKLRYIE
ncbi:hypothetical protein B0I35DRAFT_479263 [Stachybotrys elegans]|uniref:Wings apart-like protein C-terminal domain-containing protein n=1 Tax=Stachybotrys elegans TaxID=80388 RepID=A0A8K0WR38_9HYPO|nr:hypothetical protein B0I35DRAFT_479263 [Stachybotrys elegans]